MAEKVGKGEWGGGEVQFSGPLVECYKCLTKNVYTVICFHVVVRRYKLSYDL